MTSVRLPIRAIRFQDSDLYHLLHEAVQLPMQLCCRFRREDNAADQLTPASRFFGRLGHIQTCGAKLNPHGHSVKISKVQGVNKCFCYFRMILKSKFLGVKSLGHLVWSSLLRLLASFSSISTASSPAFPERPTLTEHPGFVNAVSDEAAA